MTLDMHFVVHALGKILIVTVVEKWYHTAKTISSESLLFQDTIIQSKGSQPLRIKLSG